MKYIWKNKGLFTIIQKGENCSEIAKGHLKKS